MQFLGCAVHVRSLPFHYFCGHHRLFTFTGFQPLAGLVLLLSDPRSGTGMLLRKQVAASTCWAEQGAAHGLKIYGSDTSLLPLAGSFGDSWLSQQPDCFSSYLGTDRKQRVSLLQPDLALGAIATAFGF